MGDIDVDAFAEWVLSKAARAHGAREDAPNVDVVRNAVARAIAAGVDEVHVACTLQGPNGAIAVDERFSRTAAENLFAPAPHHYEPPKIIAERVAETEKDTEKETKREVPKIGGVDRETFIIAVVIVVGILLTMSVLTLMRAHEHGEHEQDEHPAKRESRH